MTYDPRKRDSSWTMIQPGCYVDPAGRAHLFPDEVIAFLEVMHPEAGFEMTVADLDLVAATFVREVRARFPGMIIHFIQHEREVS
jgi:hypothetical protein